MAIGTETCDAECVVCPYCGHRHMDSGEYFNQAEEDTEIICVECDEPFEASRRVSVIYTAQPIRATRRG
jgi:DNA-directed RNA polymerase subunit RPC12/RpoP